MSVTAAQTYSPPCGIVFDLCNHLKALFHHVAFTIVRMDARPSLITNHANSEGFA